MAEYLLNLTNGEMDEKGFLRLVGTMLNQTGVVQAGSLLVAAQGTPDMTVKVAGGTTGHDVVFITSAGDTYHGWNTANKNVIITANSSGVIKTDAIVAYADLAGGISTSNNPGALKFIAVRRSGASTGNPTSGEIETAVSNNPYLLLSYVTVANGASSINSGNITDARVQAQLPTGSIANNAVTTTKIADANVTAAKIGTVVTTSTLNLSLNNAAITSLVTTAVSGSSTSTPSIARCEGILSLASLSIPATALILEVHLWVNAAGNNSNTGYYPVEATAVSTSSATFKGVIIGDGSGGNNFPNATNSKLQGYVRYIA